MTGSRVDGAQVARGRKAETMDLDAVRVHLGLCETGNEGGSPCRITCSVGHGLRSAAEIRGEMQAAL